MEKNQKINCTVTSCKYNENGSFVFFTNYKSNYAGNEVPLQIVLNSSGDVTNIAFQKGICEDIKTISATNTKSGVKVSWDESSYAFSYDIYRSENGEEFVKIASTYTNSFNMTSSISFWIEFSICTFFKKSSVFLFSGLADRFLYITS